MAAANRRAIVPSFAWINLQSVDALLQYSNACKWSVVELTTASEGTLTYVESRKFLFFWIGAVDLSCYKPHACIRLDRPSFYWILSSSSNDSRQCHGFLIHVNIKCFDALWISRPWLLKTCVINLACFILFCWVSLPLNYIALHFVCATSRQSLPLSGLTNAQLAEHYADCIKLSAENVSLMFKLVLHMSGRWPPDSLVIGCALNVYV